MPARSLASIQVVNAVEPIPAADAIEKVRVLGWWVVAQKGLYKVNDLVCYVEIDSLLPERPEFEFLRKSSFKPAIVDPVTGTAVLPAGFRIKTVRLRGQVSQGICFPLSILPALKPGESWMPGDDVTELLGIVKWEPPLSADLVGKAKGPFPGFLTKTDEVRIQAVPQVLEARRGETLWATEKLDGTSCTVFLRAGVFGVCSRGLELDSAGDSVIARLARGLDLETRMRAFASQVRHDLAIQGEVIGPGIQQNKYGLKAVDLYVFTATDLTSGNRLGVQTTVSYAAELQLHAAPVVGALDLVGANATVDGLVALSQGLSELNPNIQREGLVFRSYVAARDDIIGGWLSFKVINPKFLLKYDE